jgi:hypothetical protein
LLIAPLREPVCSLGPVVEVLLLDEADLLLLPGLELERHPAQVRGLHVHQQVVVAGGLVASQHPRVGVETGIAQPLLVAVLQQGERPLFVAADTSKAGVHSTGGEVG